MMPGAGDAADRARAAIAVAFAAINELPHDDRVRSDGRAGGHIAAEAQRMLARARRLLDTYTEAP